ncbi:MAG TPA: DUF547 domain-containing protein [Bacteroidia bacterium]|nr:DUF547 domain-containing protein [Bacteroidia bacterium]
MKRPTLILLIFCGFTAFAGQPGDDFFSNAQVFFSKYVMKGKVNYEAVKRDSAFTAHLVGQIESFNLRTSGPNAREAFYLNAYNILVIKSVADKYPVKSAMDIKGFFDVQTHVVAGESMTLDDLEKIKIGNEYHDPRIHFWLIPAATGSPGVNSNAIMLYNLDALLDEQLKTALNNDDYIGLDPPHKEVLVPTIFKINESDFTKDQKTVIDFINLYRKKKINAGYKINYYFSNNDLNSWTEKKKAGKAKEEKIFVTPVVEAKPEKKDTIIEKPVTKEIADTSKPAVTEVSVSKPLPASDSAAAAAIVVPGLTNPFWSDDVLSQGSYMLTSIFQIRVTGSLNTQHALYNGELNRVNNDYRTSNFNFTVQCWNRISERVNYGVQLTFRSLVMSDFNSSPYDALSFSNTKNSKFYFREVANSVKYLFHEGKWRVTGISSLLVPGSKNNFVRYKGDSLFDNGQTQWINQLFFNRGFSKYFTLNTELNGAYRFNAANSANRFIIRSALLPEFNYWFGSSVRFYVFCELNSQVNHGFFSSFYFREGAGLTLVPGKITQWDIQYHYYALGKRTVATSSFMLAGKFNF